MSSDGPVLNFFGGKSVEWRRRNLDEVEHQVDLASMMCFVLRHGRSLTVRADLHGVTPRGLRLRFSRF